MKYATLELGTVEAVFNKLGGMEGAQRFLRGELEVKEIQISDINLAKAYELMGMTREYEEAKKSFDLTEDKALWKLLMLKGVMPNKLVSAYEEAGVEMYLYCNNLDKDVQDKQRDPNRDGSYLVSFRRNVEADEDQRNQSANQRKEKNCQDNTLAERLLLGLAYFLATGEHLDVRNVTLCSGSRSRDGDVPSVCWGSGDLRVYVYWCNPDGRGDGLRSRSVVSRQQ